MSMILTGYGPRSLLIWVVLVACLLIAACTGTQPAEPTTQPTPIPSSQAELPSETADTADQESEAEPGDSKEDPLAEIVVQRTPVPTPTPDWTSRLVSQLAQKSGLDRKTFLGLGTDDWMNLGFSLAFVLAGYGLGVLLTRVLLAWIARRTSPQTGKLIVQALGPRLKWLVVVLALSFAVKRLVFLDVLVKSTLNDIFFGLGVVLATAVCWNLIDLLYGWYYRQLKEAGRIEELDPFLVLMARVARIILFVVSGSIVLSRFGINVTALAAAIGVGGLAISLAAQDTLKDAIAGFIILADRPYRVGDRIEIQGLDTWGDVVEIGLRTTRVRTRDNRLYIVPNSQIAINQIVNYSYPDPRYRIETHVEIDYDADIEQARQVLIDAVRRVEDVLPDKPVDALYVEMGASAMIFRVRWWIASYVDTRRVVDRIHTSIHHALQEAEIDSPYPIQTVQLQLDKETIVRLSGKTEL
jgi:small-conductance mechanosensitive channel